MNRHPRRPPSACWLLALLLVLMAVVRAEDLVMGMDRPTEPDEEYDQTMLRSLLTGFEKDPAVMREAEQWREEISEVGYEAWSKRKERAMRRGKRDAFSMIQEARSTQMAGMKRQAEAMKRKMGMMPEEEEEEQEEDEWEALLTSKEEKALDDFVGQFKADRKVAKEMKKWKKDIAKMGYDAWFKMMEDARKQGRSGAIFKGLRDRQTGYDNPKLKAFLDKIDAAGGTEKMMKMTDPKDVEAKLASLRQELIDAMGGGGGGAVGPGGLGVEL